MQHWVYTTLWTRPLSTDRARLLLRVAALSLTYAHNSGYKVRLYTDTRGLSLVKDFGYDDIRLTLDEIPDSVPEQLFAAGKFYAMRDEGVGSVHIDLDVLLKKPVLDRFFNDPRWDVVVQCDETIDDHEGYLYRSQLMHMLGYPIECHPAWRHSYNVGVVGFHDKSLQDRYVANYFEALGMYTKETFSALRKQYPDIAKEDWKLQFDFNLEQQTLHWMTLGRRVLTLAEDKHRQPCADHIGYAHLQGNEKWNPCDPLGIMNKLLELNPSLASKL